MGGVVEERQVDLAQELTGAAGGAQGRVHALAEVAQLADLGELGELGGLGVAILEGREVERLDGLADLAIEAALRLVAEHAPLQHLLEHRRHDHQLEELVVVGAGGVAAQDLVEVADHVADDVEADHVAEPVAAGARTAHQRAVQQVDLLDGVAALGAGAEGQHHLGDADPVADEVRGVAADDHEKSASASLTSGAVKREGTTSSRCM